ncbi:hypothetical protein TetV_562 [Tetraselmis virus 1]|uniref:Uncharacterized protein n=1 Tax=Tetraselmis virus 1 TaxID=2060617 RepID=A0A2P0VP13_9VIRU|nr:hypothetical protein QJ968_gp492 [Tetraselmis virus 1]AUF82644.1 hypothetical protein TetV_562 [Tetraselmis virus 1]
MAKVELPRDVFSDCPTSEEVEWTIDNFYDWIIQCDPVDIHYGYLHGYGLKIVDTCIPSYHIHFDTLNEITIFQPKRIRIGNKQHKFEFGDTPVFLQPSSYPNCCFIQVDPLSMKKNTHMMVQLCLKDKNYYFNLKNFQETIWGFEIPKHLHGMISMRILVCNPKFQKAAIYNTDKTNEKKCICKWLNVVTAYSLWYTFNQIQ